MGRGGRRQEYGGNTHQGSTTTVPFLFLGPVEFRLRTTNGPGPLTPFYTSLREEHWPRPTQKTTWPWKTNRVTTVYTRCSPRRSHVKCSVSTPSRSGGSSTTHYSSGVSPSPTTDWRTCCSRSCSAGSGPDSWAAPNFHAPPTSTVPSPKKPRTPRSSST